MPQVYLSGGLPTLPAARARVERRGPKPMINLQAIVLYLYVEAGIKPVACLAFCAGWLIM